MPVNDKLIIKQDGVDRELFMSFGLLNELTKLAPTLQTISLIQLDPELRTEVRKALLAERKGGGKISSPVDDPDELNISIDDTERMLKWAIDHVLNFMVRSLTMLDASTKTVTPVLQSLAPASFSDGTKD